MIKIQRAIIGLSLFDVLNRDSRFFVAPTHTYPVVSPHNK